MGPSCRAAAAALCLLIASPARAGEPAAAPEPAAPAPAPPGRRFLHVSFGFNVYTHLGATASAPASDFTPLSRVALFQQVGAGVWVHPLLRLQLTVMFSETVTGVPPGGSAFTLAAVMPLAFLTWKGAFIGAGPLLAPRAFGNWGFHLGLFTIAGYGVPLGQGFALSLAVQVPIMFLQRVSVAVTPALVLGYRF